MTAHALFEEDMIDYLAANGFGVENTSLFLNTMPDSPSPCWAVRPVGGGSLEPNVGAVMRRSSIQFQYRHSDQIVGKQAVNSLVDHFRGKVDFAVGTHHVMHCNPAQEDPPITYFDQHQPRRATWTPTVTFTYYQT